ncbi:bifunctional glycosyltransferase family 2 protein/CDP-glycerol:glycerophosphate glycerophosphotransferase [Kitasatospora sp. DSM 101779]|uniref:bifunctional glycosyltransferase/CDP-glycerol:glycerophosphate glycerophosphotransferase n=1 Tax=Kitasatospora sp. DSM 101779 TaxID=2853165 RepID=UPI0021DAE006|nr:bifunctional glycosyltransferase family 2 protein/CDP-glycerol:glycerophosphate glycerophosphotransferase [Kitasatospora sp. DSM 101779]
MNTSVSPLLSIVLPVHGVERFLPDCLDSLRAETAAPGEVEIIAVDDLSPDGCGAILDRHAARDPRLRVHHLAENRGLGGAREAGLAEAAGRWIWFVDSDDRLLDGALDAVLAELRAEERRAEDGLDPADVLLTDFVHVYNDGGTEPNPWHHHLTGPELAAGCTAADHPDLLRAVMAVWNKVLRRDYLQGLGVSFGRGYYEDISVTYPALLAAGRLRFLDHPCYAYRRGRPGAITSTPSAKHADAFAQYEEIFAFLDRRPSPLRAAVFERTVRQALTVYDTPGLVPAAARPDFFRRITAHIARHRPPGHLFPCGPRGLPYRLASRGARRSYDELQRTRALPRAARRATRAIAPAVRRAVRGGARFAAYNAFRRLPLDEHLAVYAAYWHRGYACNPAAIYERARELAPQIRGVWVVETRAQADALPPGVPYVLVNTTAHLRAMATAKYFVNNVNFPHTLGKRPGTVHLQTQHGTPLKSMGMDLRAHPVAADGMDFDRLQEAVDRWDYLVSPNPHTSEHFARAYPGRYRLLETGYPRNDRLALATAEECAAVRETLGIPAGQRTVLYAPTHRETRGGYPQLLDLPELARRLGPGHTLLVRTHYFHTGGPGDLTVGPDAARIVDVSDHPVVEDLYLAADTLVTDYSSMMFDYAVLDRPIALFAPDWDEYRDVRGVYFDLLAEPPGAVATTPGQLADALLAGDPEPQLRARFRERFCPWDDGHAAERVVRQVFPTTTPEAAADRRVLTA